MKAHAQSMIDSRTSLENAKATALKLLAYCEANDWAGYDPYDALNSRVFTALPFLNSRLPRLVLTQALKRSPINIRRLLLIPKTQNPKAIALFLTAFIKLSRLGALSQEDLVGLMTERLIALRSRDAAYWCWGYSFPWQTRTVVVPRGAPNLVCTAFVSSALLDVYEQQRDKRYLSMAASAAAYIKNELYWTDGSSVASFGYPLATSRSQTHNANFLAAALLCRVYTHTGDETLLNVALSVARYSAAKQHEDGSWDYGEAPTQRWIDNFHTGYNLCALQSICRYGETTEFDARIRRGFDFYRAHFFRQNGAARYFHNRTYPVDIHCVAQSIITLLTLRSLDEDSLNLVLSVYKWAMTHLWDEQGYFYYQTYPFLTNRISYMRWSQSWMLLALTTLLDHLAQSVPS